MLEDADEPIPLQDTARRPLQDLDSDDSDPVGPDQPRKRNR
jgi:hypothetical protein